MLKRARFIKHQVWVINASSNVNPAHSVRDEISRSPEAGDRQRCSGRAGSSRARQFCSTGHYIFALRNSLIMGESGAEIRQRKTPWFS